MAHGLALGHGSEATRATWVAIWALVFTVFGVGFGVVKGVCTGESAVNWYLALSLPLFLAALAWTVYRLRVDARARLHSREGAQAVEAAVLPDVHVHVRSPPVVPWAAPQEPSRERCPRCGRNVPTSFSERIEHGGIFGPGQTIACLHRTEGWPYPNDGESEDR